MCCVFNSFRKKVEFVSLDWYIHNQIAPTNHYTKWGRHEGKGKDMKKPLIKQSQFIYFTSLTMEDVN